MMFIKHSLGLVALNLLLRAQQVFGQQEDHTTFETEFRLMILTGDPDNMQATFENEGGGETVVLYDDKSMKDWNAGVDARKDDGNYRLTYMAWSRPSPNDRHVWIHKKGTDKESGRRVSQSLGPTQDIS
jgi:hypothetical protein